MQRQVSSQRTSLTKSNGAGALGVPPKVSGSCVYVSTFIIVIVILTVVADYTIFAQLSHGAQESIEQGTVGAHYASNHE